MTNEQLKTLLETLDYQVRYSHWESKPSYPSLVYRYTGSNDFMADNKNYYPARSYDVELYTESKDVAAESAVENLLKASGLPYSKAETYIDSEKLYLTIYSITLIGD